MSSRTATADTLVVPAAEPRTVPEAGGGEIDDTREALAIWGVMAALHALRLGVDKLLGAPVPHSAWVVDVGVWWGAWVALTPAILMATRRWSPASRPWSEVIPVHLLVGSAVALAHVVAMAWIFAFMDAGGGMGFGERFRGFLHTYVLMNVANYGLIVAWTWARAFHRNWRTREESSRQLAVEASDLALAFTEARLAALERELNPHFLSNALTSVSALVRRGDIDGAVGTLSHLGGLLRAVVAREAPRRIALADELRLLEDFLAVERIRLAGRLQVALEVDPGLEGVPVPRLILQPLVENALRHGADARGRIDVRIRAVWAGDQMVLSVGDRGRGFPDDGPDFGVGLSNTAGRLHHLFGSAAILDLRNGPDGGAVVTIRIPLA